MDDLDYRGSVDGWERLDEDGKADVVDLIELLRPFTGTISVENTPDDTGDEGEYTTVEIAVEYQTGGNYTDGPHELLPIGTLKEINTLYGELHDRDYNVLIDAEIVSHDVEKATLRADIVLPSSRTDIVDHVS